jgi:putative transposase
MTYDPNRHHRRSIRLRNYDYRQAGAYFVTICAQNRDCLFGDVVDGEIRLNLFGEIVAACWLSIPRHVRSVTLDEWIVMPNHFHGIIVIHESGRDGGGYPGAAGADWGAAGYSGEAADCGGPRVLGEAAAAMGVADPEVRSAAASPLQPWVGGDGVLRYDRGAKGTQAGSLGAVIQYFKSMTTRRINAARRLGHHLPANPTDLTDHAYPTDRTNPTGHGRGEAAAEQIYGSAMHIAAAASPLEPSESATPIAAPTPPQ